MYPTHGIPQKLCNISGGITISSNPDYHPIMQADLCVSLNLNAPSLGSSGEPGHLLYDIVFSWGGGASSLVGGIHLGLQNFSFCDL